MIATGRSGFTMGELLTAIAIAMLLLGLAIPTWLYVRNASRRTAASALVAAVALAIENYRERWITSADASGKVQRLRAWDVNGDGILDGEPGRDAALDASLLTLGYRGVVGNIRPDIPVRSVDVATGRIHDPWGQPLRIAFGTGTYGSTGFGIWSTGPNRKDDDGLGDDITSWVGR